MAAKGQLRVSFDEAFATLSGRIAEGEALLRHFPSFLGGPHQIAKDDETREQIELWHTGNSVELERIFAQRTESRVYASFSISPDVQSIGAPEKLMRHRLDYLKMLRAELRLYEVEIPAPARQPMALLDSLHPEIVRRCRSLYETGHYDEAITNALKCVEETIRKKIGAGVGEYGGELVIKALNPNNPILSMTEDVPSEREGVFFLYRGAIAALKNPQSHRFLDTNDPGEALEIIAFASFLLRRIDKATVRPATESPTKAPKVQKEQPRSHVEEQNKGILPVTVREMMDHSGPAQLARETRRNRIVDDMERMRKVKSGRLLAEVYENGQTLLESLTASSTFRGATAEDDPGGVVFRQSSNDQRQQVIAWRDEVRRAVGAAVSEPRAVWVLAAPFEHHSAMSLEAMLASALFIASVVETILRRLDAVLKEV